MKELVIKDFCYISDGNYSSKYPRSDEFKESGIPFIRANNLVNGTVVSDDMYFISPEKHLELQKGHLQTDDVLITTRGNIGQTAVVPAEFHDANINAQIVLLRVDKEKIIPKYLEYALHTDAVLQQIESSITGTALKQLPVGRLGKIKVKIHPKNEQEHIVSVLQKIDILLSAQKEQLETIEIIIKSRFIELFGDPMDNPMGWDRVNISAVVGGKVSNGFFAKRDDYCDDGNVKVLGVAHVVNRMYSNTEDLPKTNGTETDVIKYGVKYGDMLFCRSSLVAAGIGKASIVPKGTPNNVLFECHVIRLPLDLKKCVPEFMQVLSTTDYFRNQVIAQSKTATMTTIGQDGILKTDIILPPMEIQKKFLAFVEQTDKSKLAVQQSIAELEELKKALMQKYFG